MTRLGRRVVRSKFSCVLHAKGKKCTRISLCCVVHLIFRPRDMFLFHQAGVCCLCFIEVNLISSSNSNCTQRKTRLLVSHSFVKEMFWKTNSSHNAIKRHACANMRKILCLLVISDVLSACPFRGGGSALYLTISNSSHCILNEHLVSDRLKIKTL